MSDKLDFSPIANAGLTNREFARLVGTSRVTVNKWLNDKSSPGVYLRTKVEASLRLLRAAVDGGFLPADLPSVRREGFETRVTAIHQRLYDTMKHLRDQKRRTAE